MSLQAESTSEAWIVLAVGTWIFWTIMATLAYPDVGKDILQYWIGSMVGFLAIAIVCSGVYYLWNTRVAGMELRYVYE